MVTSVNTNPGALIALQNLNATNRDLSVVQNRINTGLKVSSARDDGAIFAIAQNLRSDLSGISAVKQSLDRAISTTDVAIAAGESVSDLLIQLKAKAVAAADTSLDANSRTALSNDFTALRDQITTVISNAEFNGVNVVKSGGSAVVAITNDQGTSTITVAAQDLSLSSANITLTASSELTSAASAASNVARIESSIALVNAALAKLGTGSKQFNTQRTFANKLADVIEIGIGNLVDADLAKESARLQSLQVKQQLGIQALSIANQSPSTILGLFR